MWPFGNDTKDDVVIIQVTRTAGGLFFKYKESELEKLNASERRQIIVTLDHVKEAVQPQRRGN